LGCLLQPLQLLLSYSSFLCLLHASYASLPVTPPPLPHLVSISIPPGSPSYPPLLLHLILPFLPPSGPLPPNPRDPQRTFSLSTGRIFQSGSRDPLRLPATSQGSPTAITVRKHSVVRNRPKLGRGPIWTPSST